MRRLLPILGLVCLALVVVAGSVWYGHRDEPVVLVHVPIPAAELTAWRAALDATPRPPLASDAPARAAWEALHRAEVEAQRGMDAADGGAGIGETSVGIRAVEWETAASTALQETTPELFVDLGRRVGVEFVAAFGAMLSTCAAARLEPTRCLATKSDAPEVTRYVALGGLFVDFAARAGLAERGEHGLMLIAEREPMLLAVFLDHWTRAIRGSYAVEELLSAQELAWLNRWKAEWQMDGNPDRRVAAALALAHVPDYPAELNAGVLRYAAGQFAEAAEHFGRAPQPTAALYKRLAEAAVRSQTP
jgi:hypothetical protein